ncbi:MAG TPA: gamma-glutamylcyclotransferase family protein [Vicinamibacteria bacterium]|jgi:gamma-glutamylcyclotransferase (GGCT)/AIG2-like uncharacterized protein YtfP
MLVAVYGTLKTGENNYERFLSGKRPSWSGFVEIPYAMYANGAYPMLVPAPSGSRIFVEVFEVDESKARELDALEAPYDYWRESVHIREWGQWGKDVEIYVHAAPPPEGFAAVPSGNWKSKTG